MMPLIRIDEAGLTDIPTIQKIAQSTWGPTYGDILSEAQLNYMLDWMYSDASLRKQVDKGCHFVVLRENDELPCGFAAYEPSGNDGFKLQKLYVSPEKQKRGYGEKLLTHVKSKIHSMGSGYLDLNVNRNNGARFFYEKSGFFVVREEDNYIGNGYWMNDYVMRLLL